MGVENRKPLEVSSLQNELHKCESQVEAWAAQRLDAANVQHPQHKSTVHRAQEKIKQLKGMEEKMVRKASELQARLKQERTEEQCLTQDLTQVKVAEGELTTQITQLQGRVSNLEAKSESEKRELEGLLSVKQKRLGHLHTAQAAFFQQRLGLRFDRTTDQVLRLVFTKIDARDPAREFTVGVQVLDDDRTYAVRECEPPILGLQSLVDTLNQSADLRGFVIAVRKTFQSMTGQQL